MRISDWSSDVCSSDLRDFEVHDLREIMRIPEPWVQGTGGQSGGIDDRLERWRLRFGRDTGIDVMIGRAMFLGKRQPPLLSRPFGSIDRKSTRLNSSH